MNPRASKLRIARVAVLCLAASACATRQWAKPIGDFKQSVDASVSVIGAYYEDLNAYERRLYLANASFNPDEEIGTTDQAGKPTPLAGRVFSAESIKARLDALRLVSTYGRRLADLAGSDAPTRFASNADVLGTTLSGLAKTFEGLSGADSTAKAYIGPVSSLVGLIGRVILEQKRDAALTLAIREGDAPVTAILNQFETDLSAVVDPLRKTGEKIALAELVNDYNINRKTLSLAERRSRLERIASASDAYLAAVASNPGDVVAGMRDAHRAMVTYAGSSRQPADLAEFAAALEVFANRVESAAAAVRAIRDAR
jgi:hypothetical protein